MSKKYWTSSKHVDPDQTLQNGATLFVQESVRILRDITVTQENNNVTSI